MIPLMMVPLVMLSRTARVPCLSDSVRHPCGRVVPGYDEYAADGLVGSAVTLVVLLVRQTRSRRLMPRVRAVGDTLRERNAIRTQVEITSKWLPSPDRHEAGVADVTRGAPGVTGV